MLSRFRRLGKILKRITLLSLAVLTVFSVLAYRPAAVKADPLADQLEELQRQLAEIKKKQKELQSQLSAENATQSALQSQINTYNSSIAQTELLIQESETQITLYTTQIELLSQQIANTEQQIELTSDQILDRQNHLEDVSFSLYRTNQQSSIDQLLQGNPVDQSMYKTHFYDLSREQAQELLNELEGMKTEQESQKTALETQKADSEKIKADLEGQKQLLEEQKSGLASQKSEKEQFLSASRGREAELDAQKKALDKIQKQIEQQMEAIELELLSRVQNGTHVNKGDPIALFGRTGNVLTSGPNGWYYPDPDKYPKLGAHLHFHVYKNGSHVNPVNVISGDINSNLLYRPGPSGYTITKYYSSSHRAIDIAYGKETTLGKPVYASCSGVVTYHTSYFDADDYGYEGGPFRRDDSHFYQLTCDSNGPQAGYVIFGWHIKSR